MLLGSHVSMSGKKMLEGSAEEDTNLVSLHL